MTELQETPPDLTSFNLPNNPPKGKTPRLRTQAGWLAGGGSGIRTREGVAPLHALQACPFVRLGKPPGRVYARPGLARFKIGRLAEVTGFEPVRGGQAPNRFRGGPVRPLRHTSVGESSNGGQARIVRKNSRTSSPHSFSRTPLVTSRLWLSRGSRTRSPSEPTNPAFGSAAP